MPLLPKIGLRKYAYLLFILDDQNRCHDLDAFRSRLRSSLPRPR
jgi:hypothetical protein